MRDGDSVYQLKQLRFYYSKEPTCALSLDELFIAEGKTTALMGENGSGKSTLLNILAFLAPISQGELWYKQQKVESKQYNNYRRRIGFLAQKPFMLRGTVYDNLNFALKVHGKKQRAASIQQVLRQLDIVHCMEKQAKVLSGGELQKAALARLLVLNPEVLLLDEPFSYLDQSSAQYLEQFLKEYVQKTGRSLIFSTHNRLQGVALADKVISLAKGQQVSTPLINVFHGVLQKNKFLSAKLCMQVAEIGAVGHHASIDPYDITLSNEAIVNSSMRNHFQGRVVLIADEMGQVQVDIEAGELFKVIITYSALKELNLMLGCSVWLSFKANAVVVF